VTPKGQTRDPNMLRAQYLEVSWICYLVTIAYYSLLDSLVWGSTVGYPSDSLASCFCFWLRVLYIKLTTFSVLVHVKLHYRIVSYLIASPTVC